MIAIDIFSGFLGAGKTTLIKKMIAEAYSGEKLVLIENEFGEANIDSSFLQGQGLTISEINSGCICCSLVGDFSAAIQSAVAEWKPDRILIEPSGVGKLTEIAATVRSLAAEDANLALGNAITIVDATKYDAYLSSFTEFYANQIAGADMIVLSRTQMLDEHRVAEAVQELRKINGQAVVVTTPWAQLNGRQLLDALQPKAALSDALYAELMPENAHDSHGHDVHHHHADDLFQSWSVETPKAFTKAALQAVLQELDSGKYGAVLRAKGILPAPDGAWLQFDYVPGEKNVRSGGADVIGKLCVIGIGLNLRALPELFGV